MDLKLLATNLSPSNSVKIKDSGLSATNGCRNDKKKDSCLPSCYSGTFSEETARPRNSCKQARICKRDKKRF